MDIYRHTHTHTVVQIKDDDEPESLVRMTTVRFTQITSGFIVFSTKWPKLQTKFDIFKGSLKNDENETFPSQTEGEAGLPCSKQDVCHSDVTFGVLLIS